MEPDPNSEQNSVYRMWAHRIFWPLIWIKFSLDMYKNIRPVNFSFYVGGFTFGCIAIGVEGWIPWLVAGTLIIPAMIIVNMAQDNGRATYRDGLHNVFVNIEEHRIVLEATDEFFKDYSGGE